MAHQRLKPDFLFDEEKIKQLKKIAPEAFEDGKINFQTLKENLGEWVQDGEDEGLEHFGLSWPGKKEARKLAVMPPRGTLEQIHGLGVTPDGENDSEKINSSKNIFIEGENLEVLRILKKSYFNRIKMIYIDPPYNTGKDFVYDDNFTEPVEDYLKRTGQLDEEGKPLTTNKQSDGRFHSKWLTNMYARLRLSRELLTDDGVIFISIGDHEIHHLKTIMDEIYGPECFIGNFIWNTDGHTDNQLEIKTNHEYILCYKKEQGRRVLNNVIDPNTRKDSNLHKGFAENSITKNGPKNPPSKILLKKGFPCSVDSLELPKSDVGTEFFDEIKNIGYINREITKKHGAVYPIRLSPMIVENGKLKEDVEVYTGWANLNKLKTYIETGYKEILEKDGKIRFYISSKGVLYYHKERDEAKNILSVLKGFMTTEKMRSILEKEEIYFSYPKPVDLLKYLISAGLKENEILLDFFAGSGSTAHAFYDYIKEKNINANYIMVQMQEETNKNSLAFQKGYRTIPEITRKRLSKYGISENEGLSSHGFKYFRIATSNYKMWNEYKSDSLVELQSQLDLFNDDPLNEDWSKNKLLTEIILLEGFPLDSKMDRFQIQSNEFIRVSHSDYLNKLLICIDDKILGSVIDELKLQENEVFICLDSAVDNQYKLQLSDKGLIKTI